MPTPQQAAVAPTVSKRRIWPLVVAAVLAVVALAGWLAAQTLAERSTRSDLAPSVPPGVASTAELFASLYLTGASVDRVGPLFTGPPSPPTATVSNAARPAADRSGSR